MGHTVIRGWHHRHYSEMLRYIFALLHNALYLKRIVIASDSYCFRLFTGIIADSYRSELEGQHYRFEQHLHALSLLGK
jgi:hypothetical protein